MVNTKISEETPASAFTGAETFPVVQATQNRKGTMNQTLDFVIGSDGFADALVTAIGNILVPGTNMTVSVNEATGEVTLSSSSTAGVPTSDGYRPNLWYGSAASASGGGPLASNRIYFSPVVVIKDVTIDRLGWRAATTPTGNYQIALYAVDAQGYPTGNPLVTTSSTACVAAANSAAVSGGTLHSAGKAALPAARDMAAITFSGPGSGTPFYSQFDIPRSFGAALITNALGASSEMTQRAFVSQTFGTWPDLTGVSVNLETAGSGDFCPSIVFRVATP